MESMDELDEADLNAAFDMVMDIWENRTQYSPRLFLDELSLALEYFQDAGEEYFNRDEVESREL